MATPSDDITPKVLLDHMQGMQQALGVKIEGVKQTLTEEIRRLERKVDTNEERAEQRHALVMVSLDNIDERREEIEIAELPKIKKAVGMA